MNSVDEIYRAYYEIDRFINLSCMPPTEDRERWYEIQEKNDMAYFLLVFAQFDGFVVEYIEDILLPEEFEDMGFMKKVENLLDKNEGDYMEIKKLYKVRCDIAHGRKSEEKPIDIACVCERLKQIAEKISKPPDYISPSDSAT